MILVLGAAALFIMATKKNGASGPPLTNGGIVTPRETQAAYIEPWLPYPFTLFNGANERNRNTLVEVIRQFNVASNPRYTPNTTTKCNIFVWDFTCAMGCEIPHWVDIFGSKAGVGKGSEMNANQVSEWLNRQGANNGWSETNEYQARTQALSGYPALATWRNPGGIGHQAVIYPHSDLNNTYIAQAGARNFENEPLSRGFGNRDSLQFWRHA